MAKSIIKTLLFIGHDFHRKTKSADFMLDLLREKYDVTTFYFDPYSEDINTAFTSLTGKKFDVVVVWQITPNMINLQKTVVSKHFVYFPMYDQAEHTGNDFWCTCERVKIISFSKLLAEHLLKLGLDCEYIQYFPKPIKHKKMQATTGIFFWQRVNAINIQTVLQLFSRIKITNLHMHKAIDPKNQFTDIQNSKIKVTYSEWFADKQELLDKIQEYPIYIVPRPTEGIGMSFLEAMAMGRCVIAPDKATMNEYIVHGQTGILYNLKDIKPLEPFDAEKIGKAAFQFIQDGYVKWEKEKYKIFDWCEASVDACFKPQIRKNVQKYKLFGFLPLLKIEEV